MPTPARNVGSLTLLALAIASALPLEAGNLPSRTAVVKGAVALGLIGTGQALQPAQVQPPVPIRPAGPLAVAPGGPAVVAQAGALAALPATALVAAGDPGPAVVEGPDRATRIQEAFAEAELAYRPESCPGVLSELPKVPRAEPPGARNYSIFFLFEQSDRLEKELATTRDVAAYEQDTGDLVARLNEYTCYALRIYSASKASPKAERTLRKNLSSAGHIAEELEAAALHARRLLDTYDGGDRRDDNGELLPRGYRHDKALGQLKILLAALDRFTDYIMPLMVELLPEGSKERERREEARLRAQKKAAWRWPRKQPVKPYR